MEQKQFLSNILSYLIRASLVTTGENTPSLLGTSGDQDKPLVLSLIQDDKRGT
jgi:hypothetical protein